MRRVVPSTRRGWIALGAAVLCVLFVVATARLFVWPPVDAPARADAVVALGGDPGQRRAKSALELAVTWRVPIAVISLGDGVSCPPAPARVRVLCFRPVPVDTRGEAEYVARLAARRNWRRIMVVPERSQTTRARMLFERCTAVQLVMVPISDPPARLPFDVVYEWGALFKAVLWQRSC